ncbi:MAG TPA: HlyD family efflux transporter periplasmic adaptor subunit [Dokdonella sp.]|nr:HlyD family efflux transporter periplasmic adaptor subunit [Dokdonella sp.]
MNARVRLLLFAAAGMGSLLAACAPDHPSGVAPNAEPAPEWTAVALGQIDIEGGLLRLSMPREGVVESIDVGEGEHVAEGQLMAALDREPARLAVAAAQAAADQATARTRAQEVRITDLARHAKRLAAAAAAGAGGQQSADDALAAVDEARGELAALKADEVAAKQKLDSARHELDQQSLHAPLAGEVIRRTIQRGSVVGAQSAPAFTVLPDQPRIVRAEVNSAFVGDVKVGMAAEVVEDGSGRKYTARVVRMGRVFGASELEEDPQLRNNARSIECVLALDASAPADLLIGQRVQVRFAASAVPDGGGHP